MMWNHSVGWGGWMPMAMGMTGFWILVAVVVWLLLRNGGLSSTHRDDPRDILERRLARGEIDVEEYHERLDALGGVRR